jgi:hypothetical protein
MVNRPRFDYAEIRFLTERRIKLYAEYFNIRFKFKIIIEEENIYFY